MAKISKTLSQCLKETAATVGVIVRIQNFNLGTFLKKILDIFPFAYDLIFFF